MLTIKTAGFDEFAKPDGQAYIKCLIMGDHGVGKTPSAASWPKPIIADCEKGILSVASKGTPYAPITGTADMDALLRILEVDSRKAKANRKYETLIIDTIDTYQRKMIAERLRNEQKESLSGWGDWGWLDAKMSGFLERLLSMDINVVVNMHTKDTTEGDDDNKQTVTKARLKGDVKDSIFQDFDLIGLMESKYIAGDGTNGGDKGERVRIRSIRWHNEPRYPALRDRSNKLPRFTAVDFTEQDYWRIFNAIVAGLDDLPETTIVETVATDDDAVAPEAEPKAGPVSDPVAPAAKKTAAKKAPAAKKTAAAPAKTADEAQAQLDAAVAAKGEVKAPEADTPLAQEVDKNQAEMDAKVEADKAAAEEAAEEAATGVPDGINGKGTADVPVVIPDKKSVIVVEKIVAATEHVHTHDGECLKNTFGALCTPGEGDAPPPDEPEPAAEAPEPAPEPAAPAPAAPAATTGAKHCGDQPAKMVGKHDPVPGCGKELNAENATRAQVAMLRKKTFLCDVCLDAATA